MAEMRRVRRHRGVLRYRSHTSSRPWMGRASRCQGGLEMTVSAIRKPVAPPAATPIPTGPAERAFNEYGHELLDLPGAYEVGYTTAHPKTLHMMFSTPELAAVAR